MFDEFIKTSGAVSAKNRSAKNLFCRKNTSLVELQIPAEVLRKIPEKVALENCCLPVEFDGIQLHVAVADPDDIMLRDRLSSLQGVDIQFHRESNRQIRKAIDQHYVLADDAEKNS